jgi:hypothetical protein
VSVETVKADDFPTFDMLLFWHAFPKMAVIVTDKMKKNPNTPFI